MNRFLRNVKPGREILPGFCIAGIVCGLVFGSAQCGGLTNLDIQLRV